MDERMAELLKTAPDAPGYAEAVAQVLAGAWSTGELTLEQHDFFRPMLDGHLRGGHRSTHALTLYWLGRLYERSAQTGRALRAYRGAEGASPGFEDALERVARLALSAGDHHKPLVTPPPRHRTSASMEFDVKWRSRPPDPELSKLVDKRARKLGLKSVAPGTVIADRYRVEAPLGRGGYGIVLRVTDLLAEEPLALKLFRRGANKRQQIRFKREMKLTRRLFHPGIVRSYEFGVWQGLQFLTMELLKGRDLAAELAEYGALPIGRTLQLTRQSFDALHAAHQAGVIHRDVKPENLFLVNEGRNIKVMDFGLSQSWGPDLLKATKTGQLVGTPAYMAPERLEEGGQVATPSMDIWSMGLVLFQMLTGRLPWQADNVPSLFNEIRLVEVPRASDFRPTISRAVDEFVAATLRRRPEDRIADGENAMKWLDILIDELA